MIKQIRKRSGELEDFNSSKIVTAVIKAMRSINKVDEAIAVDVAEKVTIELIDYTSAMLASSPHGSVVIPEVDQIHTLVENVLMDKGLHELAREYIVYRSNNKPDIFRKRTNIKPYEYPQLLEYIDAIRHSYWLHTEFNYSSDIQDLKINLTPVQRSIATKTMLAISQIESTVKTFWGKIYDKLPKPEIAKVGATFSESEVRHEDAYSNLLEISGLNGEFERLLEVPAIKRRVKYLESSIQNSRSIDNREYFESIILFSMFIENVSLFSQFLILMSFNKFDNSLKGISNAIEATSKEETIHAMFGFDLVNIIKSENPTWWTPELISYIKESTIIALDAEIGIINWIFEEGELEWMSKEVVINNIKARFNSSLNSIGIESIFDIDQSLLQETEWFDDEVLVNKNNDFFNKRGTAYNKRSKSITEDDLF